VRFDRYDRLRFSADVKLNRLVRNSDWDAGDEVYFNGSQPALRAGAWVHYDTDVEFKNLSLRAWPPRSTARD